MLRNSNARTNREHFTWQCWRGNIPEDLRGAVAQWAASYPGQLPGAGLKLLREGAGLSRAELAEYLGVQARQVSRWENATAGNALADRALRLFYLNAAGQCVTMADISALLDMTQAWPKWVTLERRVWGWRAAAMGELQPAAKPKPTAHRKAPRKILGLRLVKAA